MKIDGEGPIHAHDGEECGEDYNCTACMAEICDGCIGERADCEFEHEAICLKCADKKTCPVCDEIRSDNETRDAVRGMRP